MKHSERNKCAVMPYIITDSTASTALRPWETLASQPDADSVNHPSHYNNGSIEVIDYIRDKLSVSGFTDYCAGNVMKYISRWRLKNGVEDLRKAAVYLNWMIESAEKENKKKHKKYKARGDVHARKV